MTPEDFITKHLLDGIECSDDLKERVVEASLTKYRRCQFDHVSDLIYEARRQLIKLSEKKNK